MLLNAQRIDEENCPALLNKWDKVFFDDITPILQETLEFHEKVRKPIHAQLAQMGIESHLDTVSSEWIGMNILSINPETVVVDERQHRLIKTLESHKLTVVPISFRHSYYMGGTHCSTLDTVRDSKLENYFD